MNRLQFFNIAGPLSLKLSGVDNPLFALILGGIGVFLGILTSFSNSGSHLNPAVTTSFAVRGMLPWKKVPHYIAAQYLGKFRRKESCFELAMRNFCFLNIKFAFFRDHQVVSLRQHSLL